MKTPLILLLLYVFLIACCGCSTASSAPEYPPVQAEPESSTHAPSAAQEATEAPVAAPVTYTLYLPNDNADGFVTRSVLAEAITADGILTELQSSGVLPADGIIINAFGSQGDQLNIDFNDSFADAVNAMGTSGEYMIIGSVVNTFLNAFQAQSVFLTVNGEILESGHVIYDFPLTFYE